MPDPYVPLTEGYRDQASVDPQALVAQAPDEGLHNINLRDLFDRQIKGNSYQDRSTIMVVPAVSNPSCLDEHGEPIIPVPPRVVQSWLSLQTPANQRFTRIMIENAEVSDAYNQAVAVILGDQGLNTWKWLLTVETDNIPPPGGLLQLLEDVETVCDCGHILASHDLDSREQPCKRCACVAYAHVKYDAIGGIYFAKGPGGSPMCYGRPHEMPRSFRPWIPPPDSVVECNGLGMGFSLFRIEMFKEMPKPWFRTIQEWVPGIGERHMTQDLAFFGEAAKFGYRFAISTNVRVGHIDSEGVIW